MSQQFSFPEQEQYNTINDEKSLYIGSSLILNQGQFEGIYEIAPVFYPNIDINRMIAYRSYNGKEVCYCEDPNMENGLVIVYKNGVCTKIENRKNGKRVGVALYAFDNNTKWVKTEFQNDKKNGYYMEFYPNSLIMKIEHFKDDLKEGYNVWFYKDGKIMEEGYYVNDLCREVHKKYYSNGQLHFENEYEIIDNRPVLVKSTEYWENGQVRHEGGYENGLMEGVHTWYYKENGKKWMEIYFEDGLPCSGAKKWDKEDNLVKHSIFTMGIERQIINCKKEDNNMVVENTCEDSHKRTNVNGSPSSNDKNERSYNNHKRRTPINPDSFIMDLPYGDPTNREPGVLFQDILQVHVDSKPSELVEEVAATDEDKVLEYEGEQIEVWPLEGGDNVNQSAEERSGTPLQYGIKIDQKKRDQMNASLLRKFAEKFTIFENGEVSEWKDKNGTLRMVMKPDSLLGDEPYYDCTGFYSNGDKLFHCKVKKNFILHGYYTQFYLNGFIRYSGLFINGKRENIHRMYHENGSIKYALTYHNDKLTRESLGYYEDGKPQFFVSYIDDVLEFKYVSHYPDGKQEVLRFLNGEKNGIHAIFDKDEKYEEYYDHGVLNGVAKTYKKYFDSELLTGITTYKDGKKHGLEIELQMGIPVKQVLYENGEKKGDFSVETITLYPVC